MKSSKENSAKRNLEDIAVVERILIAGEKSAFSFIQNRYSKLIASLIRKMIKDEDDVDDLTQETFIKAFNALGAFNKDYSFSAWICRIASNSCIDFLRKKRFPTISLSRPLESSSEDDVYFEIEDNSYIPDKSVLSEEKIKAMNDAIAELPENYREIIRLRHEEELDYAEISAKLSIPLGTVKAHLFRARKILALNLKKSLYLFND